jgi:hypothetical protein
MHFRNAKGWQLNPTAGESLSKQLADHDSRHIVNGNSAGMAGKPHIHYHYQADYRDHEAADLPATSIGD